MSILSGRVQDTLLLKVCTINTLCSFAQAIIFWSFYRNMNDKFDIPMSTKMVFVITNDIMTLKAREEREFKIFKEENKLC
jgi:hypothetical protein